MKHHWLLPFALSSTFIPFLVSPANAARLSAWYYQTSTNQIRFATDTNVVPRAFLISSPERLIVDLPGTRLDRPTSRERYNTAVREIRVAEVNSSTTRIVVELKPGFSLAASGVSVTSELPSRWTIKFKEFERTPTNAPPRYLNPTAIYVGNAPFAGVIPLGREMTALKRRIKAIAAQYDRLDPGMFFMDLETGNYVDINGDGVFPAASTIKFPILVALFEAVDAGKVRLDEVLTVRRDLIAGGSGSLQYSPGARLSVLATATKMSALSDNTATNMIIDRLGGKRYLNSRFQAWGLNKTFMANMLGDFGGTNKTTPADLVRLSALIAKRQLLNPPSRQKVLDILNQTRNRSMLPAGLGSRAAIAHKTGTLGRLIGDAGIIEMPNGKLYFAGIFVRRPFNDPSAREFAQKVSKVTYEYINQRQIADANPEESNWGGGEED
jgi:beta-lactamase class A